MAFRGQMVVMLSLIPVSYFADVSSPDFGQPHKNIVPIEFSNGGLGIWLKEESGQLSPNVPPPRPTATPSSPSHRPAGAQEARVIKEKLPWLSVKREEVVSLVEGAEVGSLTVSGRADVQIDGKAHVAHVNVEDEAILRVLGSSELSFVTAKGHAAVHGLGGKIGHLNALESSTVHLGGTRISHLTMKQQSIVRIDNSTLSFLTLEDEGQAFVHKVEFEGGNFSRPGLSFNGGGILYAPRTQVHFYATDVSFSGGIATGKWDDGKVFSIPVVEHPEPPPSHSETKALSAPAQVFIHDRE